MAFKTKEELFGDNGANGLQADIDTAAPTGYDPDNRAVGFGEPLTSAISNRIDFALAKNDEDLDGRVTTLQTAGLDGAYDVGRTITKDAGAITTESALATTYADDVSNAHYRADAESDSIGGSTGFDFAGKRTVSGNTAGFLDRRVLVYATARTDLSGPGMAATLNPGGTAATVARVTSPRFFSVGSVTDLLENYDLLEVSGAGASNGVYVISDCTLADGRDAFLTCLDGTSPSFSANTACTVTAYRVAFWSRVAPGANPAMVGFAGNNSVLDLIPVSLDGSASTAGSRTALRVMSLRSNILTEAMSIDDHGRVVSTLKPDGVSDLDRRSPIGAAGFVKQYVSYSGTDSASGFVAWEAGNSATTRHDVLALRVGSTSATLTVQFDTNSPVTGVVEITAGVSSGWQRHATPHATYGYIAGSTASSGLYVVTATAGTPDRLTLRRLGGAVPDNLPTSATATMRLLYGQRLGAEPSFAVLGGLTSAAVVPSNILSGDSTANGTALVLAQNHASGAMLRCLYQNTSNQLIESAQITDLGVNALGYATGSDPIVLGEISSSGSHRITGATGTFQYDSARSGVATIPASELNRHTTDISPSGLTWSLKDLVGDYVQSESNTAYLTMSLNKYLPEGTTLTQVEVLVTPGAARTGTDRMLMQIRQHIYNWTSPGLTSSAALVTVYGVATTATSVIDSGGLSAAMGGAQTTQSTLIIRCGIDGATNKDKVYAVRLHYTYATPGGLR